jgi:hypothetical protein
MNEKAEGLLAWSRTGEPRVGIEASRYVSGQWTTTETLRAGGARRPSVALDGCGNAIVIWSEPEGQSARIWANRFDTNCR